MKDIKLIRRLIVNAFLMFLVVDLTLAYSLGNPWHEMETSPAGGLLMVKGLDGRWTIPMLVYNTPKLDVYIGEDAVNANIFNGNFFGNCLKTGNFSVELYIKIKDEASLRDAIKNLHARLEKNPAKRLLGHPDLLRYVIYYASFDMQGKRTVLQKWEKYIDRDGDLIAMEGIEETHEFARDPFFKQVAQNIPQAFLNGRKKTRKSPTR